MTGVSTLGQALAQIDRLNKQQVTFADLSTQLATGKKTQKFSGLQTAVLTQQRSRASFTSLDTYINNITNADRRMKLTLAAIEEFKAQAENFAAALVGFSQQSTHQEGDIVYFDDPLTPEIEATPVGHASAAPDVDFESLQDLASSVYDFLTDLLNAKDGDRYLLSGADSLTQPLVDAGLLDSAISAQISDWKAGTISNTALKANLQDRTTANGNPDAITDSVVGYSAALSANTQGKIFTRVNERTEIDYTVLANDSSFRDILVIASYFKNGNLPPMADQVQIDATTGLPVILTEGAPGATTQEMKDNFFDIFNELTGMINRAIDDIDQQRFKIESARARIDEIKISHQQQQNVLLSAISDIEDVDLNEVAVQLNSLEIQLDASYRITARIQELSLVNFI